MLLIILVPVGILTALGVIFGAGLAIAGKVFEVKTDPRMSDVREALPGANCGACGFPGCDGLAAAIVEGKAGAGACPVGGAAAVSVIAAVMGIEAGESVQQTAAVICGGAEGVCKTKYEYHGTQDCRAAALASGGAKSCRYACMGLGTCMRACPFGAIRMENGIAAIDTEKCTGCGSCVAVCPKNVLRMQPKDRHVSILCRATEKGKAVRDACTAGCIACGRCFKACKHEAIIMENNLPMIDYDKCVQCGDCARACPTKSMYDTLLQ